MGGPGLEAVKDVGGLKVGWQRGGDGLCVSQAGGWVTTSAQTARMPHLEHHSLPSSARAARRTEVAQSTPQAPSRLMLEACPHIDDGGPALLALLLQEGHQIRPAQHIQVHRDLVQQQHLRLN